MKTKFTNNSIGHAWFHRTSTHGEGSNISFEDDVIYSYGTHFPIAKRLDDCVLFTTDSYRQTTAKHMTQVRRAIDSDTPVFDVADVMAFNKDHHRANYQDMQERIADLLGQATRARTQKEYLLECAIRLNDQANAYTKRFKLGFKAFTVPVDIDNVRQAIAETKAKQAKLEAKRQRQLIKDNAAKIQAWRDGESVILPRLSAVMLRVKGDVVETSHHANFPADHAARAWRIINACAEQSREFIPNGNTIHLGHYQIDRIETNGNVKAGCHYIQFDEIRKCAAALGLLTAETA